MKNKKQAFALGIVTRNRKKQLKRLLNHLNMQISESMKVIIVENGSHQLDKYFFSDYSSLDVTLIKLPIASIPKSRNTIINKANNKKIKWLLFLDDDCTPEENWLENIISFTNSKYISKKTVAIQGSSISTPTTNSYAVVSGILNKLWFDANTKNNKTKIIDTKNCALNLYFLSQNKLSFDTKLTYASDIDLAYQIQKANGEILYTSNWIVKHMERNTLVNFYQHRLRTSYAFQIIQKKYKEFFSSVTTINKLLKIHQSSLSVLKKTHLIQLLIIIYFHSKLLLLVNNFKIFYRTVFS